MSKKNCLRAKISRNAKTGRDYKLILHTNFVFFEYRIFYPYFRQFKSWKHNRETQYNQKLTNARPLLNWSGQKKMTERGRKIQKKLNDFKNYLKFTAIVVIIYAIYCIFVA